MSIIFANEEKKAKIRRWYDIFRNKIPVPTEDAIVQTSFGKTHALITGPVDAPPLVLLHGALASSAHALPELGALIRTRRVYALDVIGQSVMSEDARIDLNDDSYGRWVVEATSALGVNKYDLFGVSWGGFVARRATQVAPERLDHLVLLVPAGWVANSFWGGLRESGWPLMRYRMAPSEKNLRRFMQSIFTTLDDDWSNYFGDALDAYRFDIRVPPQAKPEDVKHITCPTLIFGAELDSQFPGAALIKRAKELLPQAEVELMPGVRHSPPLTDEFRTYLSERVERFLNADKAHMA